MLYITRTSIKGDVAGGLSSSRLSLYLSSVCAESEEQVVVFCPVYSCPSSLCSVLGSTPVLKRPSRRGPLAKSSIGLWRKSKCHVRVDGQVIRFQTFIYLQVRQSQKP